MTPAPRPYLVRLAGAINQQRGPHAQLVTAIHHAATREYAGRHTSADLAYRHTCDLCGRAVKPDQRSHLYSKPALRPGLAVAEHPQINISPAAAQGPSVRRSDAWP